MEFKQNDKYLALWTEFKSAAVNQNTWEYATSSTKTEKISRQNAVAKKMGPSI